ncbi:hypothetical protein [Halalkalicoccus jeotgali]|uniref:Uncharacterized protein n=1 Tax=Halalkalicoccus jeotgali (strain DSM 18796 / CECT 7217 / JCM 14584 / KCTC 4019 / B3) TaxID=795797 RepID=D8J7Z4_HALJB|nr:hypothetical protein [Halalkalicoccus jeotgali]ADJ14107.1 hypothetical protein HacjB3_03580 [Halalkalicoccus jeotgali B3]ELY34711.1 hypothetical protein C497_15713 [Halalkalicoccus jeotgali B3]
MSVRTALGFYRAHWLSLTMVAVVMALYFTSALLHGDYWHVLAGALVLALGVGWLWRRYEPPA